MSKHVNEEEVLEDSGFSVDIRLVNRVKVAVEVDGPSHYVCVLHEGSFKLRSNGPTRLKHRLLTRLGWTVTQWSTCPTTASESGLGKNVKNTHLPNKLAKALD